MATTSMMRPKLEAVSFDFRGVLLDHRTNKDILPGMKELLSELMEREMKLAVVSRFQLEVLEDQLGQLLPFFRGNLCSSSGRGKLDCIRELSEGWGIHDLASIALVDDKPDNLLSVWQPSDVYVIGFRGSGKYPEASAVCLKHGIPFAENVEELRHLLESDIGRHE